MKRTKTLLAVVSLALAPAFAQADLVSYSFTGNVSDDEADRGYQAFSGSFSFDSTAVNQIVDPSGSTGSYTGSGPAWSMNLAFDGGVSLDFGSQGFHLNVMNNLGGYDWLGLLGTGSAGTVSAGLYDFTMALLDDASLPLRVGGYVLSDFGWSDFSWESDAGMLRGVFASLNCTAGCAGSGGNPGDPGDPGSPGSNALPEPGSWALVALALTVMLFAKRLHRDRRDGTAPASRGDFDGHAIRRGARSVELRLGQGLMVIGAER